MYGRAEYANKAIDEYRLAIENDPTSDYLNAGLAELYARTGRIKDAVLEAQDILKRDGNNLEAHRLLGRIYLRSLGDMQSGNPVGGDPEAGDRAVPGDRSPRSQERRRPPAAGPPLPSEQRPGEGRERIQDRRKRSSRLGRRGHRAVDSLQRRGRHLARAGSAECVSRGVRARRSCTPRWVTPTSRTRPTRRPSRRIRSRLTSTTTTSTRCAAWRRTC